MGVYSDRIQKVRGELHNLGAEAALITSPLSVAYLTGFVCDPHERFMGLLLQETSAVLFVPSLEQGKAEAVLSGADSAAGDIIGIQDTENPYEKIKQSVGSVPLSRVAIEKEYMRVTQAEHMQSAVSADGFTDIGGYIARMRSQKSPEEVAKIRAAAELVEEVLAEGLKRVARGVTELELVAELEYLMKKKGAAPSFETMVLAGANSALPHGVPGAAEVQEGGFLLFDLGVFKDGYCSDITRTFAVGEASAEMENIYHTVLAAEEAAIRAVQVGSPLAEVDRAARRLIDEAGYGSYFMHRIGHGLGMEIHEYPSVHGANEEKMMAGMVFTIEPGIYVPGVGGVRIEDDIHVGPAGAEVLTSFSKALTRLEI